MLLLRPPLLRRAGLSRRLTTATATAPAALAAFETLPAPATHPAFDIVRNVDLREDLGDVTATLYKHKTTGAEILSMKSSDNNKVFGVTFGTPPSSSNGVAHILEHSVLCGGQKYPLKEPFVELLKGSMNTFLNAFTYPDRTCYPVASTNLKDFYNLIDVYLDAVFVPNITELTFKQEGWHLAPDTDKDPDQLIYRGVVFNEMKGVYSQPDSLVHRHMSHAMYPNPTHVYGVDSGGDPVHIPELSYEEFVDFHKQYYRPSNARIFFFGDDCEEERLRLVEATFDNLLQVDPNRCGPMPKPKPPIRPLSDGPGLKLKIPYVVDEVDEMGEMGEVDAEAAGGDTAATGQYYAMSGWVLNEEPLGLEESITMSIANDLLVGNTSSTLYRDLMDSQLGTAFIGGGLSDELQQATFSAGLKGVHEEDCSKIDQVVQQSLQNVVAKGFAQEAIDASVNSTEFSLLEFNTGGMPRGLSLMLAANPCWLYQDDPFLHLEMKKAMRHIRAKVDDHQPIFSDIVNRYLVQNSCRASVELIPDPALGAEQERLERDTLDQIRASITLDEFEQIKVAQTELLAHQSSTDPPEVLNLIPRLQLSDLEPAISTTPRAHGGEAGGEGAGNATTVLVHEMAETNGIVYVEVVLDASDVDMAQLKWLPMFTNALTQTGTDVLDEASLTYQIGTHTGGLGASVLCSSVREGGAWSTEKSVNKIVLRGKATVGKVNLLFDLMGDVLLRSNVDNRARLTEMIRRRKEDSKSVLLSSGHSVATGRLKASLTKVDQIQEQMGGLSVYEEMKHLNVDEEWGNINTSLHALRDSLVHSSNVVVNITSDTAGITMAEACVPSFVDRLPTRTAPADPSRTLGAYVWAPEEEQGKNEGFGVASQVNYVVQGGLLKLGRTDQDNTEVSLGSASVVSRYLRNTWLWDEVRVKGGAYGGFCSFDGVSNVFAYGSYRDPNLEATLNVYKQSPNFLQTIPLGESEINKGIIGTISDADTPQTPSTRGYTDMLRYLVGETDEHRQQWRDEVLSTKEEDFRRFGDKLEAFHAGQPKVVVVGGTGSVEEMKGDEAWRVKRL